MLAAAKNLSTLGPCAVLLKGDHITVTAEDVEHVFRNHARVTIVEDAMLSESIEIIQVAGQAPPAPQLVVDVLYLDGEMTTLFLRPRINSTSTHGTGCTLSAALACGVGRLSRPYSRGTLSGPCVFTITFHSFGNC
jgi:hydroxymethylpyrimidine/phosphomethylpyrimidine kinase / thiaminase